MSELQKVLDQRASRYGDFKDNAVLSQELSSIVRKHIALAGKINFPEYQLEAITIIMQKVSRIIYGDHNYDDNYIDIAGYATRVANYLTPKAVPAPILRSELQSDNELYNNIVEAIQDLNKTRSELYTEEHRKFPASFQSDTPLLRELLLKDINKNIKEGTVTKDNQPSIKKEARKMIYGSIHNNTTTTRTT